MSLRPLCLTSALALMAAMPAVAEPVFNRIASFATPQNMAAGEDLTRASSAEIITVTEDGMVAIYSDSPLGVIGLIDLSDPKTPKAMGNIDIGGEPTTTVVIGDKAYVGVNTSESYTNPSGKLVTVDLAKKTVIASCDLGGQPDSVARAKDGSFLAVAIENERDEEVNEGALPQMPAGFVVKLPLTSGALDCAALQKIDLAGLAEIGGDDPEPEYVDVNEKGEILVSLQENNHIVVIGADGAVSAHFSAGTVDLEGVDTKKDGAFHFDGRMTDVAREPDAVKWIGNDYFVTANEGDWKGGTRGFTIFARDGSVAYDSGATLEYEMAKLGHYNDKRNKKGVEIESVEVARFGAEVLLFVVSERASLVAVYKVNDPTAPVLKQILPSGISPEGIVALPARELLLTANEVDLRAEGGAPAHVMIFARSEGEAAYPMIKAGEGVTGFAALSGLAADPQEAGKLYAVSDSVLSRQPSLYTIDARQKPAVITSALTITRGGQPAQKLDLEGLASDGKGGFWLANEGDAEKLVPHAILHVDGAGEITEEIALPVALLEGQKRFGLEGVALQGERLWAAVQREWGDDPKGLVKLLAYDLESETWGAVHYPLEATPEGAWMGLSEITIHGDYAYILERDNQIAEKAAVKKLFRVKLDEMQPAELGTTLPVVTKEEVRDFIPDLKVTNGYVVDKVEGFTIDAAGEGFVVTDNDGTDDSSGETYFWSIGQMN